jgi:hypothetical protein
MNTVKEFNIGDIVQSRHGNNSFVEILELEDENGRYLVRFVKSKYSVPIRQSNRFLLHRNWLSEYKYNTLSGRWEPIGLRKPIERN